MSEHGERETHSYATIISPDQTDRIGEVERAVAYFEEHVRSETFMVNQGKRTLYRMRRIRDGFQEEEECQSITVFTFDM